MMSVATVISVLVQSSARGISVHVAPYLQSQLPPTREASESLRAFLQIQDDEGPHVVHEILNGDIAGAMCTGTLHPWACTLASMVPRSTTTEPRPQGSSVVVELASQTELDVASQTELDGPQIALDERSAALELDEQQSVLDEQSTALELDEQLVSGGNTDEQEAGPTQAAHAPPATHEDARHPRGWLEVRGLVRGTKQTAPQCRSYVPQGRWQSRRVRWHRTISHDRLRRGRSDYVVGDGRSDYVVGDHGCS